MTPLIPFAALLLLAGQVPTQDTARALVLPPLPALPPGVTVDMTETLRISDALMSPFCPGLTLTNCPSPSADSLRRVIHDRLAAGESSDKVVASLVADFGEGLLGAPPAQGFSRVLWLAPAFGLLLGLGAIYWLVPRLRTAPVAALATPLNAADQARLDEAMRDVE